MIPGLPCRNGQSILEYPPWNVRDIITLPSPLRPPFTLTPYKTPTITVCTTYLTYTFSYLSPLLLSPSVGTVTQKPYFWPTYPHVKWLYVFGPFFCMTPTPFWFVNQLWTVQTLRTLSSLPSKVSLNLCVLNKNLLSRTHICSLLFNSQWLYIQQTSTTHLL